MLFVGYAESSAQDLPIKGLYDDYLRVLQLDGRIPVQTEALQPNAFDKIIQLDTLRNHPWSEIDAPTMGMIRNEKFMLAPYDPLWQTYWHATKPGGKHDGPVWQGRGWTSAISTGFFIKYGFLSASFHPYLIYNQNRSFTLSPYQASPEYSHFAYPLGSIDWPQRFGNGPFWTFDPGPSYIRADVHGWAAGISNENLWWSPAIQNSILMSNNAPGFRHIFFGTNEPKNIYIGSLEANLFWGKLLESDYFDYNQVNNERYITGMVLAFHPKPIPNLTLGAGRTFYETIPREGIPVGDLFNVFEAFTKIHFAKEQHNGGNDRSDQMISLFGRWVFPKSGFELYAEWARNDHSWNWRDFIDEPGHSRGYTIGFQKTFNLQNDDILAVNAEITQLSASKTSIFRGFPTFYQHHIVKQGYSNKGQLLGAAIGPGGESEYLGGKWYFGNGRLNVWTQRVVKNNDFLYRSDAMLNPDLKNGKSDKYWLHNVQLNIGASLTWFYNQWEATVGMRLGREFNENYIYKNDHTRTGLQLSIRYRLSSLR